LSLEDSCTSRLQAHLGRRLSSSAMLSCKMFQVNIRGLQFTSFAPRNPQPSIPTNPHRHPPLTLAQRPKCALLLSTATSPKMLHDVIHAKTQGSVKTPFHAHFFVSLFGLRRNAHDLLSSACLLQSLVLKMLELMMLRRC